MRARDMTEKLLFERLNFVLSIPQANFAVIGAQICSSKTHPLVSSFTAVTNLYVRA